MKTLLLAGALLLSLPLSALAQDASETEQIAAVTSQNQILVYHHADEVEQTYVVVAHVSPKAPSEDEATRIEQAKAFAAYQSGDAVIVGTETEAARIPADVADIPVIKVGDYIIIKWADS